MTAQAGEDCITAVVIAFNEAVHIRRCIERLQLVADRIVVVDSFSTDGTTEIAAALGVEVYQNPFTSHAAQFQWGVERAEIENGWILRVDCDEYLEPALIEEIRERLPSLDASTTAIEFRRKVFFQGKWIRWGGYYNTVLVRLWRVGAAHIEQRWMDEQILIRHGQTERFSQGDIVDDNLKDITWWTNKHNGYTTRQMIEFINLEYPLMRQPADDAALSRTVFLKRLLRNGVYARSPLYLRALLYYLQRYIFRLGFLDGRAGFIFHTLQGFWNFLLMDVKVGEARRFIAKHGIDAFRDEIARRHGIKLPAPDQ